MTVTSLSISRDAPGAGIAPNPSALYAASPLDYWVGKIGSSMEKAVCDVRGMGGDVCWQLPPTLGHDIVMWAVAYIDGELAKGLVNSFYIGLTSLVYDRWWGNIDRQMVGHRRKNWHRMTHLAVSDQAGVIADAEREVISFYRGRNSYGRPLPSRVVRGRRVGGDSRCENRNQGGEGGHGGIAPHCLYVCMRWWSSEDMAKRRRLGMMMIRD